VPVRHALRPADSAGAARLPDGGPSRELRNVYFLANGGKLFIPARHKPERPGLVLIPHSKWDAEREHLQEWLEDGGASDLPSWARTAVPFAAFAADADRWVMIIDGPFAGAVMLAEADVPDAFVRYESLAHFFAALNLMPEEILRAGDVSYSPPGSTQAFHPVGYRQDD
jgi:hypothetical protein